MAPSATTKPSEVEILPGKVLLLKVLPPLAIFGTFTASALAMKIAPLCDLLPGDTNKEIITAWTKFAALPELKLVLEPLAIDATKFMIAVAALHLAISILLVLPSGKWGIRIAGLWAMVSMAGAEFCTRKTAFVPAGFPEEYQWLGVMITTVTHLALFLFGALMVFGEYRGTLTSLLNELVAAAKTKKKTTSERESDSPSKQRGREASKSTNGKRDSTPKTSPMKNAMKKADSPTKSPMKSSSPMKIKK